MRATLFTVILLLSFGTIGALLTSCADKAEAGPYGGDLLPIESGAKAELVANSETGEVMVHTWDNELQNRFPIRSESITIGSGEQSVELSPHPHPSDPPGRCSQFYGQAEWMRNEGAREGWMMTDGQRREFNWSRCWKAGRTHGPMWTEMGEHRRMGMERGQGQHH